MMKSMTDEQREQRETLLAMGYTAWMLDNTFEPHEFAMLIQESLIDDLDNAVDEF